MANLRNTLLTGAAVAGLMLAATPSFASADLNSRFDALENRVKALETENAALEAQLAAARAEDGAAVGECRYDIDPKKLQIATCDGDFSIRFGGRLQLDAAVALDDDDDFESIPGVSGGLDFGAEIRRARFFADGNMFGDWYYKLQIDFEEDADIDIEDAYIEARHFSPARLRFGNFKHHSSLEELTSSKYITFMERAAAVDAFAISRQLGTSVRTGGDNYSFGVSAYCFSDSSGGAGCGGQNGGANWGTSGRVTFAPIAEDTQVVHLGIHGQYNSFGNDGTPGSLGQYDGGELLHVFDETVSTGSFASDDFRIGGEAAVVFGPFSAQGEYFYVSADVDESVIATEPDASFHGGYAFISYFLTGESRAYGASSGSFRRVKAENAVELAARIEFLDLEDDPIFGGEFFALTFGGNYYFNPNVRVMVNYVYQDAENATEGSTTRTTATGVDAENHLVGTRLQIDF